MGGYWYPGAPWFYKVIALKPLKLSIIEFSVLLWHLKEKEKENCFRVDGVVFGHTGA